MKAAVFMAMLVASVASQAATAGQVDCLIRIMHSEAQGESLEGLVAVAEATLNRAEKQNVDVCKVAGVTKRKPPMGLLKYYKSLAVAAFASSKRSLVRNADSWNVGRKPNQPGEMVRVIGRHAFYIAANE